MFSVDELACSTIQARSVLTSCRFQLQGSTWKGQKVRIAEAQPDYKQKIRSEAAFSESEEADTGQPASEEEDQQLEDIDPEGPSQVSYRIRSPHGQTLTLPCCGTGNKRSFFNPVKQLSMADWLCQDLDTQSSSRYHRNSLWEQMVDAQASRPDLDPELFSSSAVLPVSMVRSSSHCTNTECASSCN